MSMFIEYDNLNKNKNILFISCYILVYHPISSKCKLQYKNYEALN